ncbi:MAG: glycine betaine/proline transport system substrate-binding protein [Oceanospirillaceae bacterium]|jgi:glycine betaine/proline transport system substrate-binding protein
MNKFVKVLAAAGVAAAMSQGAVAACGKVTIAEMNWASAEFMANVDKIILEAGYGCSVELIPGATLTTFASMDTKGVPDVAPELWTQAVEVPLYAAFASGRLHSVNPKPIAGAGEGWVVPDYTMANHPELKTVLDIIERPDLFPFNEDPSKGAFVGCPAGWGCQQVNANLFRAFDMEAKGWVLVDPGSAAGLDGAMAKAVDRGEDYFGYYWSPTAMMGKFNMEMVDFGVPFVEMDHWTNCITQANCMEPQQSAWSASEINTIVTDSFINNNDPKAVAYFGKRVFPAAEMGAMLVYMGDNQAGGEDAAIEFLLNYESLWTQWVGVQAANLIKKSLN